MIISDICCKNVRQVAYVQKFCISLIDMVIWCTVGTELIIGGTELIIGGTELILGDTDLSLGGIKPILNGTELILSDTELILGDTELILGDTKLIIEGTELTIGGTKLILRCHRANYSWQRNNCWREMVTGLYLIKRMRRRWISPTFFLIHPMSWQLCLWLQIY